MRKKGLSLEEQSLSSRQEEVAKTSTWFRDFATPNRTEGSMPIAFHHTLLHERCRYSSHT